MENFTNCPLCNSSDLVRINSYKYSWFGCCGCNCAFNKKTKHFLIKNNLISKIARFFLPVNLFNRLFYDIEIINDHSKRYESYATCCINIDERKKSEFDELLDTLKRAGISPEDKTILDISGGPGYVGKRLKEICKKCIVTEYSEQAAISMAKNLDIEVVAFDFNRDKLENVVNDKFNLILIRSSLVFCKNIKSLIHSLKQILQPGGYIYLDTIEPSMGEILFWQQDEGLFPFLYSCKTIEEYFQEFGFILIFGQKGEESYWKYYKRLFKGWKNTISLILFQYPFIIFYYLKAVRKKIPFGNELKHKVVTQIWQMANNRLGQEVVYRKCIIDKNHPSSLFGMVYKSKQIFPS